MSALSEERVLKPLDPLLKDNVNEWPDFALREVKIFPQGKARYADLFEASEATPLLVLGELMPLDDDQEDLALIENPTHVRIKLENVVNYSFGQDDDGKPVIWAAGRAGWFEISPSDRYASHYNDTAEAVDLFYFMVDQYNKLPRKRKRLGFVVDQFLTQYQKHTDYRIDDDDEAMETIHKHHRFLLKQMIEQREGIDWSQTHLWNHLAETYADEVEEIKAMAAKQANANGEQDTEESESDSEAEAEADDEKEEEEEEQEDVERSDEESKESTEEDSEKSKISQAHSHDASLPATGSEDSSSESESDEEEDEPEPYDWTRTIWDMLNYLRKSGTFNIRSAGIEDIAIQLRKLPVFTGSQADAVAALERSAEELLRLMNEAKLRKKFNWSTRRIYDELEATLADEVAEETMKTPPGKTGSGKQRHRMKSVLRPSGGGKAHKGARGAQNETEDEEMSDAPFTSPVAKRHGPGQPSRLREMMIDSTDEREDSPSRQLNGHYDPHALPELPPPPETQEMLNLVSVEAKRVGRQYQTSHLQAFLGQLGLEREFL